MKDKIITRLKELIKHEAIELTSKGDIAIFAALYCARKLVLDENYKITKKTIVVPDQGGWFSYEKYPKMLELDVKKVKTDYGIIDLDDLKKITKNACAFIYQNPAGYFADQPIKKIYNICKKNHCLVIMDVTGCIGDNKLYNGDYSDINVCSFGRWKPLNVHYGGFLSARKKEYFGKGKEIFNTISFDEQYFPILEKRLNSLKKRLDSLYKKTKKVKEDLKDFKIIHKNKKGINVVVKFSKEEEKEKIINYCKNHNLEYTLCPRYIRVMDNAVSIEIKRWENVAD